MYQYTAPLFIRTLSPLHAGTGDNTGHIDLPIQRESHTNFPKIEGSGIKGAFREAAETKLRRQNGELEKNGELEEGFKDIHRLFGYDRSNLSSLSKTVETSLKKYFGKGEFAAPVGFGNAKLLLFPVKSAKGVFAYVTCPMVLNQLADDLEAYKTSTGKTLQGFDLSETGNFTCSSSDLFIMNEKPDDNGKVTSGRVILDEYGFELKVTEACTQLANFLCARLYGKNNETAGADNGSDMETPRAKKLRSSLVILSDDDFADYVQYFTEVITRIKIDNATGTVDKGQLFSEEFLPAESVLYCMVNAAPEMNPSLQESRCATKVMEALVKHLQPTAQIGADATIGKGLVNLSFDLLKTIKNGN